MKAVKVLWGLIVDDVRLVVVLSIGLVLAWGLTAIHQPLLAAVMIWIALMVALWVSIDHQARVRRSKQKS